jgi:hypothetical protein
VCSEKDCHEVGMTNVVVVPQVGHGVVRQKVTEVAELIGSFWEKQERYMAGTALKWSSVASNTHRNAVHGFKVVVFLERLRPREGLTDVNPGFG